MLNIRALKFLDFHVSNEVKIQCAVAGMIMRNIDDRSVEPQFSPSLNSDK